MGRRLISWRPKALTLRPYAALIEVSLGYSPPKGRYPTCYSPVRRSFPKESARLACVKPPASVRSEPGSNSPIKLILYLTHRQTTISPSDGSRLSLPAFQRPNAAQGVASPLRVQSSVRLHCPSRSGVSVTVRPPAYKRSISVWQASGAILREYFFIEDR